MADQSSRHAQIAGCVDGRCFAGDAVDSWRSRDNWRTCTEVRAGHAEVTSKTNRNAKLPHFAKGQAPTKKQLKTALEASAKGIETSIRKGWANGGKLPGFKRGVIPLVGYLIVHESHHRGSILLTLKQTGHRLTDELKWGLWDWNKI